MFEKKREYKIVSHEQVMFIVPSHFLTKFP